MTHQKDVVTFEEIMANVDQIPKGDPFARGIGPVDPLREQLMARVSATYSEGETLLRAQAAEANQRAAEFYERHESIKAEAQKLAEAYAACETRCAHQSVIIKRAHGALADAGDVPVPELHERIDETIRAIVRERDEERMRTRCLEQALAEAQADLRELKKATK